MELFGYWECAKYGEDPEVYRKVRKGNAASIVLTAEGAESAKRIPTSDKRGTTDYIAFSQRGKNLCNLRNRRLYQTENGHGDGINCTLAQCRNTGLRRGKPQITQILQMAFGLEYLPPTGKATDYTDFADGLRP